MPMRAGITWAVLFAAPAVAALGGCGGEEPDRQAAARPAGTVDAIAAQRAVEYRLLWLGARFDGLPLTRVLRDAGTTTFVYGSCTPVGDDDGGCSPPLQIQVTSICERNALVLDVRPGSRYLARGVTVLDYGEGRLELDTRKSHVVVWSSAERARRAVAALRPVGRPRVPRRLSAPRYPAYYVAQLRRVFDAYARTGSVRAVRNRLGISQSAVRFELALARELGPERLHRVGAAPALADVKRDRMVAAFAEREGEQPAATMLRMPERAVRARARRGRELRSGCVLEPAPASSPSSRSE